MIKRKEVILYCVAGTLGTVLYFAVRFGSRKLTGSVLLSVLLGQGCAIVFAFFANKFVVFKDGGKGFKESLGQFIEFLIGRLLVIGLDLVIAYTFVSRYYRTTIHVLHLQRINYQRGIFTNHFLQPYLGNAMLFNEFLFTMLSQFLGMLINYVISKKIVFNIKKESYDSSMVS